MKRLRRSLHNEILIAPEFNQTPGPLRFANYVQHFIAQFLHGSSMRLDMDSGQRGAAFTRQLDVLHAPADLLLAAGQDTV